MSHSPRITSLERFNQPERPVLQWLKKEDQDRILHIQLDIEEKLIEIKVSFFQIGKLLSQAKAILPHGAFQRWIEETWGKELPYPTAACFKAIYERFKDHPPTVCLLPITLLQQMAQPTFPDEVLKLITDKPEALQNCDIDTVKEAFGDFKSGKIDLGQFEALAAKQIKIGMAILEGRAHARNSLTSKRIIKTGFRGLRTAIWKIRKYTGKLRVFFPSAEGEELSSTEQKVQEHNCKVDEMMTEILDDDLLGEIDLCIKELKELRVTIEDRRGFFRQRLVEEDGVIRKREVSNL